MNKYNIGDTLYYVDQTLAVKCIKVGRIESWEEEGETWEQEIEEQVAYHDLGVTYWDLKKGECISEYEAYATKEEAINAKIQEVTKKYEQDLKKLKDGLRFVEI